MILPEKYPEHIPWDIKKEKKSNSYPKKWILKRNNNVFRFNRDLSSPGYIHIQKNDGYKKTVNEYQARFTFQRLFDDGYELTCVDSPFCCL